MLLIARDGTPLDAKDIEEVVMEVLRLAFLIGRVLPLFGKCGGADADFIPGESCHGLCCGEGPVKTQSPYFALPFQTEKAGLQPCAAGQRRAFSAESLKGST